MKVIYARYNRQRIKKYQTATIIYQKKANFLVKKKALTIEAVEHIRQMSGNYKILKKTQNYSLTKTKLLGNNIFFEYIEGESLESLLIKALMKNDIQTFYRLLQEYVVFVSKMSTVVSKPCSFIFAENLKVNEPCFEIGNLDVIFENIIVNKKGEKIIIDYEWVFPNVPMHYVIYRAMMNFIYKYSVYIKANVDLARLFYSLGFSTESLNRYDEFEMNFQKYVNGLNSINSLYQKKRVTINH